jgi:hypothetical protein
MIKGIIMYIPRSLIPGRRPRQAVLARHARLKKSSPSA